ncbi:MAG: DNA topoisomerase [Lachnospiraceae bacterium]|nr:DNA topoisomerase [Lachnospiraceae bacterium]
MDKSLFIAEKPSVAKEFAKALKTNFSNRNGYMESDQYVVTWCVGHLVTMSYPEVYDEKYKRWSFDTIPFIPDTFMYEVIGNVKDQFKTVSGLLNRPDVTTIYVCTDSGREGEYIYRLVERQANVTGKQRRRVWIDSQTEEEILRGIKEAKDLSEYDNLCAAAYLRAKEDYLMGINFSRALTLKYSYPVKNFLKADKAVISVGRVMTCVLGMVVNREREIRSFVKVPFYRVLAKLGLGNETFDAEWKVQEQSIYFQSPKLYKDNGFKEETDAQALIEHLSAATQGAFPQELTVDSIERKKEVKNPPLLYNLAELQNDCAKYFKISPDQTLQIMQELYEKKLTTYPRTDARVLSTAVSKEIHKNIGGLRNYQPAAAFANEVLEKGTYKNIAKTRYVNDKQITDHYALVPTGQGLNTLGSLHPTQRAVYDLVVRRFLSIFYPAAIYSKVALTVSNQQEKMTSNFKVLAEEGYLKVLQGSAAGKKGDVTKSGADANKNADLIEDTEEEEMKPDQTLMEQLKVLKKGMTVACTGYETKAGETSPPKRYNSGTMILTMENAGQFIEDEELRAQMKGSGIGTSATRAEILNKLVKIGYLGLNKKTQILTPTLLGEMVFDVVNNSIKSLLDPALTASWEKGLTQVAEGQITEDQYMEKLSGFVIRRTDFVKKQNNQYGLNKLFEQDAVYYKNGK